MEFIAFETNGISTLYACIGWSFWGVIVSVVGTGLSVYFAWQASKNAKKAADAADNTRRIVSFVDTVSELSRVLRLIKEVRMRVDRNEWDRVSELAEDVRVIVAGLSNASVLRFSENSRELVTGILVQMTTLGRTSDAEHHRANVGPPQKPIDPVRIKSVLGGLSQDVAVVLAEIKEKVGP